MYISKLVVKNYKLLKDVNLDLNERINIFVGENDSGKSTILEVLSIITSGKLNGYAFERQIKANMFNDEAKKNIELGNTYFNNPKISNINKLWVLMAKEKKIKRIKWIILFSFPKIAKFFWKG